MNSGIDLHTGLAAPRAHESRAREWLATRRAACDMRVDEIPRSASAEWTLAEGRIRHRTNAFFSITGVRIGARTGSACQELPLIDQPEIGLLGFVVRGRGVHPEVLVQAKPEPGNIGLVQLAPSVQATESNYCRRHGGRPTALLEAFGGTASLPVLCAGFQSEQGSRFLGKYNRNMVVEADRDWSSVPAESLSWFAFEELQPLLLDDFCINTDARSVLATAPWSALATGGRPFLRWQHSGGFGEALLASFLHGDAERRAADFEHAMAALRAMRRRFAFEAAPVPLHALGAWTIEDRGLRHVDDALFEVRQYRVESSQREVDCWDQPLAVSTTEGTALLLCQRREGILRFLFSGQAEPGFRECLQLGPTVQVTDGPGEIFVEMAARNRVLRDVAAAGREVLSSLHSDEGGRFFRSVSRYSIVELDEQTIVPEFDSAIWLSVAEVATLVRERGVFSNEARSLISMLLAFL